MNIPKEFVMGKDNFFHLWYSTISSIVIGERIGTLISCVFMSKYGQLVCCMFTLDYFYIILLQLSTLYHILLNETELDQVRNYVCILENFLLVSMIICSCFIFWLYNRALLSQMCKANDSPVTPSAIILV